MSMLMEMHQANLERKRRLSPRPKPVAPPPAPVAIDIPAPVLRPNFYTPFNFLKEPGPLAIVKLVALRHGLRPEHILGKQRYEEVVNARDEAIWLIKSHRPWMSLPDIGRIFDKDHTTILHSLRKQRYAGRRKRGGK